MKNPLVYLKNFIKKEPVLFAALVLAITSVCLIRPAASICAEAIDFRTLAILFSLMIVIKAFQSQNFLDFIASRLLRLCKDQKGTLFSFDLPCVFLFDVCYK